MQATKDIQLMELLMNGSPEKLKHLIRTLEKQNDHNVEVKRIDKTRSVLVKSIEEHLDLDEACRLMRRLAEQITKVQEETGLSVHVNVCIDPMHPHEDFQSADMTVSLRDKDTGQSRPVTTRRFLEKVEDK